MSVNVSIFESKEKFFNWALRSYWIGVLDWRGLSYRISNQTGSDEDRCPGCGEIDGPNCGGGYCCR